MKQRHLEILLDEENLKIYTSSQMKELRGPINYSSSNYFTKELHSGWDIYEKDGDTEPKLIGFINGENVRWCSECGYPMIEGHTDEQGWYACSEGCFNDAVTEEEKKRLDKQWEETNDADIYWTNWHEL